MKDKLMKIYKILPVPLQNIAVTMQGFRLKKQRYGGNSYKYISELDKSQYFDKKTIKENQEQKLRYIVKIAYDNVPYYRKLFRNNHLKPSDIRYIEDLNKIPVLEKETVKKFGDEFVSKNIERKDLVAESTGGTTGTPLVIYYTKDAIRYIYALGEARFKHWAGVKSGDKLASFLHGVDAFVPMPQTKPPFWRWNKAYNQLLFSVFHMNENNLKYYVKKYNEFQPKIIQGYTSAVDIFAKYILKYKIKVFAPKAILVSSETLFDIQRKNIEKAFNSKVYNGYSGTENVALITECEKGRLHINPECSIVEFKKIMGTENKYEIIGTNLYNFAMPLLRYRTGDILTLTNETKCPCGRNFPLIKSIEGRTDDMLMTPEGNYIGSTSMSMAIELVNNIQEVQIIQNKMDEITVNVVKLENFNKYDLNLLKDRLKERLGKKVSIKVVFVNQIKRTRAGKFKFIISNITDK
jgi:phenylacetate-CoA ligase